MLESTVKNVCAKLKQSPKKSLRRLSQEIGVSYSTYQRATKTAGLRPYRVTSVHQLMEPDKEKIVQYCLWFKELVCSTPEVMDITWFTDEAWFHQTGYVNSQNSKTWATENPHGIHESPLHSKKVGVWCAKSGQRIIGPIFV